jgi:glycosyltransferase involved in cell wall biosynthesis
LIKNKIHVKKKIAVIGLKGLPAFGGAATVGENIIDQLKNSYDFTVYSVASHTNFKGNYHGYYQHVFKAFPVRSLNVLVYYIKSLFHCLFYGKYDLIHLHHVDGAFILPLLRLRYKVVTTSHARPQYHEKFSKPVRLFFSMNEKIMLLLSNRITAVARPLADFYRTITNKPIYFIPNGISLKLQIDQKKLPYSNYILFAAGRIIPSKGCHLLLKALRELQYKGPILVIGDVGQLPKYEKELTDYKSLLQVEFIDIIKDKSVLLNYVKNALLFVYPTMYEAMSIMLLETAFSQTPIVCSDIPANTAMFTPDEVLFFKNNDVQDLKKKLVYALENPKVMNDHAKNAFTKLKQNYTWGKIAGAYDEIYSKLTN